MNDFDRALFLIINAGDGSWGSVAWLAFVLAKFVIYLVPAHLAVIWVFGDFSVRRQAIMLLTALLLALSASYLIGAVMPSQRPFLIPVGNTLMEHRPSPSFPSNHGLVMFTYAAALAALGHWRHFAFFGILGMMVAWSRIYLGVHFPLDMAGAVAVAGLAAWAALRADRTAGRMMTTLAENIYFACAVEPIRRLTARFR
ncbi:phosphatase PAP2 family protein [Aquamicrobium sp. LC103]|uniref:phosphatase PAP2 family protein n=1 Tax=Aquamicrobium sp. LC103 TaxID=1120658 RepID=UPI00063E6FF0|nr:phosphatase PAP2 family protein [Aquamicrobium sp. LC103]